MNDNLLSAVFSRIEENEPARLFLQSLMRDAKVYLFGGGVRDYLDGSLEAARDLDFTLVSRDGGPVDIEGHVPPDPHIKIIRNRYDGLKIIFGGSLVMDVWNLEDTWGFKNGKLPANAENLIHSVYLNLDGLVYSLDDDKYLLDCDKEYERIKAGGEIDIVNDDTPFEELNLLRALVFEEKYSMALSDRLRGRIKAHLSEGEGQTAEAFMELQEAHYGSVIFDVDALTRRFREL